MSRIGIVIPWFGRILKGGAERHAWQLATRLAARGHAVEVVTTCCRAHTHDWAVNHLPAGLERESEGFDVRRFPVEPRDSAAFDVANGRLLAVPRAMLRPGVSPVAPEDERTFCSELIRSPGLVAYLAQARATFDAVILLPYLYGVVIDGLHAVADRALLQPCLHDEPYAYLPAVAEAVYAAQGLLFLSEGERQLAVRLFGPGIIGKSTLTGAGVDLEVARGTSVAPPIPAGERFVLCLGRKDAGKKTDFLVRCFLRFREQHPASSLRLVLAGPGSVALPDAVPGLVELGEVSESDKAALLHACAALFHPSENESYSRVIMEAWLHGRPVAVNTACLATATAVGDGGGWLAESVEEWAALFATVDAADAAALDAMGAVGNAIAADLASWDRVITRYEDAIERGRPHEPAPTTRAPVHQMLPNLAVGDAISNHARWIRRTLKAWGHPSELIALDIDPRLATEGRLATGHDLAADAAVIYHHSIGSAITPVVQAHAGPKCLVYHNITPPGFLAPYLPLHARLCAEGLDQLPLLAPFFELAVGDSGFNATDLATQGFHDPGVLPVCVEPAHWQMLPDPALMARLQDGRTNVLFVGRIIPNKRQEDLIVAFARLRERDPQARLLLVGGPVTRNDHYLACLEQLCRDLDVADHVVFAGHVRDDELAAYFRTAHLFWSMSEHEGFCVPLVEAMWFDVPVLAFAAAAVPETLGGAGIAFASKDDFTAIAAHAHDLLHDPVLRRRVVAAQRERREAFLPASVAPRLRTLVDAMLAPRMLPAVPARGTPAAIDPAEVRRIAVVKLDHIGDLLLAQPVFESLAMRFPDATITAVVAPHSAVVLQDDPHVAEVVAYDPPWFWREAPSSGAAQDAVARNGAAMQRLSAAPFDLVVNLRSDHANVLVAAAIPHRHLLSYTNDCPYPDLITHPLTRTHAMHICEQHRALLASIGATHWGPPRVHPTPALRERVAGREPAAPGTVAVFPGAGVALKRWSAAHFRELVRRLRALGHPVVVVGAVEHVALAHDIAGDTGARNVCGRFDLQELAVYLEGCAVLVSNDSAPVHVAAAMGTPVVTITRPNVAAEFAAVGAQHRQCTLAVCERPCEGFNPDRRGAPITFCRCIQAITVDDVLATVLDVLGERVRHASGMFPGVGDARVPLD